MASHFRCNMPFSYYKRDLLSSHILKSHLYFLSCELFVHIIYPFFFWLVLFLYLKEAHTSLWYIVCGFFKTFYTLVYPWFGCIFYVFFWGGCVCVCVYVLGGAVFPLCLQFCVLYLVLALFELIIIKYIFLCSLMPLLKVGELFMFK